MTEIFGNTSGLSPQAHRALERIYRRRVSLDQIASLELARSLVDASRETKRQVGALVHRSGSVESVIVGSATGLMLPDIGRLRAAQGRFRALRLIHTHLFGEGLTQDDLTDLTRLRLDMVAAILLGPDGEAKSFTWAYNIPAQPEIVQPHGNIAPLPSAERPSEASEAGAPSSRFQAQLVAPPPAARENPYEIGGPVPYGNFGPNFGELISSLEDEFTRLAKNRPLKAKDGRAILVHVAEKRGNNAATARASLNELHSLAETAGVAVVDNILQLRDRVDPKFVFGRGKLEEVVIRAIELDVETLIFDRDLTPAQASAISSQTDLKVIDRSQLILDIFAQRAETRDGKLQVELAQLKYTLPRLGQKDDALSRLTGGIGGRGPGETKLEIGRRRARERVNRLEKELKQLARQRAERRRSRKRSLDPVVAIIGYTNAGKSTLLNTITGASVLAENKLFATLDTRARRMRLPSGLDIVLTDTVGFIRKMPKDLFAAFRATFEETADADLLVEVVDASDPEHLTHQETTQKLLQDLDLDNIPRLLVFNKLDRLSAEEAAGLRNEPDRVLLSALDKRTTQTLLERITQTLLNAQAAREAEADAAQGDYPYEIEDDANTTDVGDE